MTFRETKLENGVVVATDSIEGFESVSVGVFVGIGSVNESDSQIGLSHFLEHMVFKGTSSRSAAQISGAIESVGGFINAYTCKESTAFFVKLLRTDEELAVDIISDMVQNPAFDLCEFEKERGVIIQEIRQLNDVPNELVFDMFQEQCFYGKRLGTQILGNEDLITSYGVGDLKRYISAKYSSDRIMICAAGGVVHDQLLDLSNRFVSKMLPFEIEPVEKQEYVGGYIFKKKNLGQTHLVLGFEGLKHTDDNKFSMGVLSNILGGGMSSRLFQEVREKRGLAYSIFSFENRYIDTGVFGIYAACDDNDAKDVIAIVREECEKIRINVEEEELIKAKAQMKASILMGLESSMSRMQRLANQLMFLNEYIPPSEIAKKIDEVNLESVKNIAEKVFRTRFTMAVLGNCADIEKLYDPCT